MQDEIIQLQYPDPQRILRVREDHAVRWSVAETGNSLDCIIARLEIRSYVRSGMTVFEALDRRDRKLNGLL